MANNCGFQDLRKKILEKPSLTLLQVLDKARAIEASSTQVRAIEQKSTQLVNAATHTQDHGRQRYDFRQQRDNCGNCGGNFHEQLAECPARFHQCTLCKYLHHFEGFCRRYNMSEAPKAYTSQPASTSQPMVSTKQSHEKSNDQTA